MDINRFAQMSCNPAVGGIAKGQIVREIDALGGFSGIVTDCSTLQFRMLNRSKGPAMWSPRAQCDKNLYSQNWRKIIESSSLLDIYQDTVTKFLFNEGRISGVCTTTGAIFNSRALVLTAGTFLNGRMFIGRNSFEGGRIGEQASYGLTEQLKALGVRSARMKTGTPPRIDISSIDVSKLTLQSGDKNPSKFSYLPFLSTVQSGIPQMPCYIVHTNSEVHDILRSGFKDSPLFQGMITGIGPRYCPSIEDKLRTFADKDEHQLFLEPEGRNINEYYLQGFSSSLPLDIQLKALHSIKGLENVKIYRPAYAVEYDYFDPTQLKPSLEMRDIECLFMAGQVNGTTGYEEAAALWRSCTDNLYVLALCNLIKSLLSISCEDRLALCECYEDKVVSHVNLLNDFNWLLNNFLDNLWLAVAKLIDLCLKSVNLCLVIKASNLEVVCAIRVLELVNNTSVKLNERLVQVVSTIVAKVSVSAECPCDRRLYIYLPLLVRTEVVSEVNTSLCYF